ncbi:O-antigen ligase family protein, partial [Microcoleus sp. herbarium13]
MARLIKELILTNNLLLVIFGISGLIITLILFQIATKKNLGITFEKWFAILYIFISPHVNIPPFNYLHFINLTETDGSTIAKLPFVFYPWIVFVLCGRFLFFLRHKFVEGLSLLLFRNPAFSLYCLLPLTSTLWSLVPDITLRAGMAFTGFTVVCFYVGARYEWHELSGLVR